MNDDELTQSVYIALSARHADTTGDEMAQIVGAPPERIMEILASLAGEGLAVSLTGGFFLSDISWKRVVEMARRTLTAFHKKHPFQKYAPLEILQQPLSKSATVRDFDALARLLAEQDILVPEEMGKKVRLPDHEVKMPPRWEKPSQEILAVYQSAGLQLPDPTNFQANYPRDISVRTILQILAENGELASLTDTLYIHADALAMVKETIRGLASQMPEGITPGSVRDATASSRKIILPLLEYLDEIGFTQRRGDTRTLAVREKTSD